MTLRVLGRVEQQADHRRRKPRASHLARLEQRSRIGRAHLGQRALHRRVELGDERVLDSFALLGATLRPDGSAVGVQVQQCASAGARVALPAERRAPAVAGPVPRVPPGR